MSNEEAYLKRISEILEKLTDQIPNQGYVNLQHHNAQHQMKRVRKAIGDLQTKFLESDSFKEYDLSAFTRVVLGKSATSTKALDELITKDTAAYIIEELLRIRGELTNAGAIEPIPEDHPN